MLQAQIQILAYSLRDHASTGSLPKYKQENLFGVKKRLFPILVGSKFLLEFFKAHLQTNLCHKDFGYPGNTFKAKHCHENGNPFLDSYVVMRNKVKKVFGDVFLDKKHFKKLNFVLDAETSNVATVYKTIPLAFADRLEFKDPSGPDSSDSNTDDSDTTDNPKKNLPFLGEKFYLYSILPFNQLFWNRRYNRQRFKTPDWFKLPRHASFDAILANTKTLVGLGEVALKKKI